MTARSHVDTWAVSALAIVVVVLFPVVAVLWMATFPAEGVFGHLVSTVLPRYLANSLLLMASAGVVTGVIGTVTAWLVVMCSFRGERGWNGPCSFPWPFPPISRLTPWLISGNTRVRLKPSCAK